MPNSRIVGIGLQLIVLLFLTISPLALLMLGWQYEDTGGGPIEKFHPATLLLFAVFLIALSVDGNPLTRFPSRDVGSSVAVGLSRRHLLHDLVRGGSGEAAVHDLYRDVPRVILPVRVVARHAGLARPPAWRS